MDYRLPILHLANWFHPDEVQKNCQKRRDVAYMIDNLFNEQKLLPPGSVLPPLKYISTRGSQNNQHQSEHYYSEDFENSEFERSPDEYIEDEEDYEPENYNSHNQCEDYSEEEDEAEEEQDVDEEDEEDYEGHDGNVFGNNDNHNYNINYCNNFS